MSRRRGTSLFLLPLLSAACLLLPPALEARDDLSVSFSEGPAGVSEVEGHFDVDVPASVVWDVLTDYGRIGEFSSSIQSSRIMEQRGRTVLLEQVAVGKYLFFGKKLHLMLQVTEQPFDRIAFEDVSGRDFEDYAGSWTLLPQGKSVTVLYQLRARPRFMVPSFAARRGFSKNASILLEEIRSEILRRAKA